MGTSLVLSIPILIVVAAFQSTFVPQIRFYGGTPDFVFLIVLSWAVNSEFDEALTWAVVGGIIQDLLSAAPTGASALGMIIVVFFVHLLNRRVYRVGFLMLGMIVIAGTVTKEVVFALVLAFTGFASNFVTTFSYVIVPTAVYNLAVLAPVYVFTRLLQKRFQREPRVFQ